MKTLFFFICISLVVLANGLTEQQKEKIREVHRECQSNPATKIDENVLAEKLKQHEDVSGVANIGPHSLCLARKLGLQKENGDVDKEGLRSRISKVVTDEARLNEIVNDCSVQKATPEETAKNLLKCFHEHIGPVRHH